MPSLPYLTLVTLGLQVKRYGYYAVRQRAFNLGGNLHDVTFILANTLIIQGA